MPPKTFPIPKDPQDSEDTEAAKKLRRQDARSNRSAPPKSAPSSGSNVGGRALTGGARVRGGRA